MKVKKRIIVKDLLLVLAGFFYSFFVAKTRILIPAYGIAIIVGFLLWKADAKKKIIGLIAIVVAVTVISQLSLFSFLIEGLNEEDNSSKARAMGREYYLMRISEHPILGCGYINTANQNAVEYSGKDSLKNGEGIIAWVDLGVYGLTFFFGLIGFIWFLILYGRMTYHSLKVAKAGNLTYIMYMLYCIVLAPNGTGFLWNIGSTISLVVWLAIIEREYKNCYQVKIINNKNYLVKE